MAQLDRAQILAYRHQVSGFGKRLATGGLVEAARPGLQDSSPRSGVISLHARVEGVTAEDWSDRRLVQVWGPRGAVYLISKDHLAMFTLGLLPRDPDRVNLLESNARKVLRALDGRPQRPANILDLVPAIPSQRELLWAATTGWFLPIWDASATAAYPAEPADADPEESRLELARLFFHYLGPATSRGLQWWTGGSPQDAAATIKALAPELATVDVAGEEVLMLRADVSTAQQAPPPDGLLMLPPEDVYINRICGPLLAPTAALHAQLYPQAPLPGALLLDGEIVATWRRRGRQFTVTPVPGRQVGDLAERVAQAATALPLPGAPETTIVDWANG
jgi:hypothetical protein